MRSISSSQVITLKLAEAITSVNPTFFATYINTSTKQTTGLAGDTAGVTAVTVVPAASSTSQNLVKHLDVLNLDTVEHTFIVLVSSRQIIRKTLQPNEHCDLFTPSEKGDKGDVGEDGASTTDDGIVANLSFEAGAKVGGNVYMVAPFDFTIQRVCMASDASASVVIDIKKSAYSGFPTTASICASAKPAMSIARKYEDGTLTGWTTAVSKGDILEFVVDSSSGSLTNLMVALSGVKP